MKLRELQYELRQTAAIFGRNVEATVVFAGDGAATNGRVVFLPALALEGEISDENVAVMRGYLDHEAAGHVRQTSFPALNAMVRGAPDNKLLKHVHNAIEDMFIERNIMLEYPGSKDNLRATSGKVNGMYLDAVKDGSVSKGHLSSPWLLAPLAITWMGRLHYGGPSCAECLETLDNVWLREALPRWHRGVVKANSTEACIALAKRITKELEDQTEKEAREAERDRAQEEVEEKRREREAEAEAERERERQEQEQADGDDADGEPCETGSEGEDDGDGDGEADGHGEAGEDQEGDEDGGEDGHTGEPDGGGEEEADAGDDGHDRDGGDEDTGDAEGGDDAGEGAGGDGAEADTGGEGEGDEGPDAGDRESADGGDEAGEGGGTGPDDTEAADGGGGDDAGDSGSDDGGPADEAAAAELERERREQELREQEDREVERRAEDAGARARGASLQHGGKDPDLREAVRELVAGGALGKPGDYMPISTAKDSWSGRTWGPNRGLLNSTPAYEFDHTVERMTGEANQGRRALQRMLEAERTRSWSRNRLEGSLDPKRLVAAAGGAENVFRKRAKRADIDTAVTLLLDLSGSMWSPDPIKTECAADCMALLATALERTGVAWEALGFGNETVYDDEIRKLGGDEKKLKRFTRFDSLDMLVFKPFEERLFENRTCFASIRAMRNQWNNTDGEAVLEAWYRLRKRREVRKILLVLSDGMPVGATIHDQSVFGDHLKVALAEVEADGVDVAAIGIQTDAVKQFYARHIVVRDAKDLAVTGIKMLDKLLKGVRK